MNTCKWCGKDNPRSFLTATADQCQALSDDDCELTQLRALRDRLVAITRAGIIPRGEFLAIIARAQELAG